jgi:Dolichyl-phosphate-mannose-protein mannosyltransferase
MLALLLGVLIAHPVAETGVSDDWSYIWSAKVLAETGHLTYNGWATAMLGWQVYLGALFVKLFGFSFTATRASVLIVSLLCAALIQRVFVRSGTRDGTATIATLTLVLSPLFLPLSFSFMTDIPGLFVIVISIYCCLRAFQANSDKAALGWITCAALSNVAGGTVRQVAWLGVLVMVPSAVWHLRSRRYMLSAGAGLWIISVAGIAVSMHWFHKQPYAVIEKLFFPRPHYLDPTITVLIGTLISILPIASAFLLGSLGGKNRVNILVKAAVIMSAIVLIHAIGAHRVTDVFFGTNVGWFTNKFPDFILGSRAQILPLWVQTTIIVMTLASAASVLVCLTKLVRDPCESDFTKQISNSVLIELFAPFTVAYVLLVITRSAFYDRYYLPLALIFAIGLIRIYRQSIADTLPCISILVGIFYAAYGVCSLHDYYSFNRARLLAIQSVLATGVPRTAIEAGFEYDAWTQVEQFGYVNESKIIYPEGAYKAWTPPPDVPEDCIYWFSRFTPSLKPSYYLSTDPGHCFRPSALKQVEYDTWMPPRRRSIYILASR